MRRLGRRLLGDQRIVLRLGVVAAFAAAAFVIFGLPKHASAPAANAEAQVLLDTNHSQLVTSASEEVVNLPLRATLISDLVASEEGSSVVARDAGIAPSELTVIGPSSTEPAPYVTPMVANAALFATAATTPYVALLNITGLDNVGESAPIPIISIDTQAPNQAAASRLADAAISALKSAFGSQSVGQPNAFVVRPLSPARIVVIPQRSKRPMYAVVGGLLVFILWYSAAYLVPRIASRRRRPQPA